ncbi:copper resistance protein CopC [Actinoplanes sp. NPDC051851]|uniref:copper resistance CopC/CopD family protein n=1 Tax=Actinoplanes sp. NPDC051851 TaxID=3154753 RepID=UPI003413E78F
MLLILMGVILAPASPALAHAATVGAVPSPGSVIGTSPTEVTVTFSESITPVTGRIQVIAPDGERISGLATARGSILHIPVRKATHPLGTYLVSYRVISADSHPVGGAVTFSVGAPSARPSAATTTGTHPSVRAAVPTFRFLGYAGLTLTVGPALFLAYLWPRRRSRTGPIRAIRIGLSLIAVAALGALGTQAQQGSGAALWQVSAGELGEVASSRFGLILIARLAIVALLAFLLPPLLRTRRPALIVSAAASAPLSTVAESPRTEISDMPPPARSPIGARVRTGLVLLLAIAGMTTWPLIGHASAAPIPAVSIAVDVVHIAAMSVWLGGLITLTVFLLRGTDRRILGVLLPVWSRWAALAVVWLVFGGVIQAVIEVGSVSSLLGTGYGRLLLAKVGILVLVLGAAALARRMVRAARSGAGLRRTVGIEVAATVVILALSAVLVQVNPGRSAAVDDGAVTGNGVSETLTCPLYTLQFNIYPVELGEYNTVHAFLYTPEGNPLPPAEWQVSTRLLDQDLEPVTEPLLGLTPANHALGSVTFPLPGTYEVAFTIRVDDLNRATVKTTVKVTS